MGSSSDKKSRTRGRKIDKCAAAEFSAWADALHVSERELIDAVETVGDDARHVIAYLMTRVDDRSAGTSTQAEPELAPVETA